MFPAGSRLPVSCPFEANDANFPDGMVNPPSHEQVVGQFHLIFAAGQPRLAEIARFDGVPPNMSVNSTTPLPS